jgi:hypothetical protein
MAKRQFKLSEAQVSELTRAFDNEFELIELLTAKGPRAVAEALGCGGVRCIVTASFES